MTTPTFSEYTQQNNSRQNIGQPMENMSQNNQLAPIDSNQQVVQQQPNDPFAIQKYNSVMVPDAPVQFSGGLTESLLNDNEVPNEQCRRYAPQAAS